MQPLFSRLLLRRSPSLRHHLLNPNSNPKPSHLLRSISSSSAADSDLRKYAGYFILVLGCGAATYYSFPFPADAKHKRAQIFKYAPLPDDLHTVSNWSGTHEVATRVFIQPESIPDLEKAVKEANEKRQRIRPVGSGLSPNGIGLSRYVSIGLYALFL